MHFAGSPPQIAALASGDLEIGALGASSLALAIVNAHLDTKIVGDVIQDGLPDHFNAYFMVKKDGPVRRIEDMKGRRAAINALGSPVWMELHVALARRGLGDKDYTVIEAAFPNMFAMIDAGKVDLVPVISPKLAAAFDATGHYKKLFTAVDEVGRSPDLVPNLRDVQDEIDTAVELKLLPGALTVTPAYVDLSMIEEAKARIDGK